MLQCKFNPGDIPGTPLPITREAIQNLVFPKHLNEIELHDNWMVIRFTDGSALRVSQFDWTEEVPIPRSLADWYVIYYADLPYPEEDS